MPAQGQACPRRLVLDPAGKAPSRRGTCGAAAAGAAGRKLHLLLLALLLGLCAHVIHADDPHVAVLIPGAVVEGFLAPKTYRYFEIASTGHTSHDLVVTATPLGGDVDLFMSVQNDLPFPDRERFEWSSTHLGTDSLMIAEEDPKNCRHQQQQRGGCVYRVGVYGYIGGGFTLLARWNSSEPVPLTLGRPQSDSVTTGTFRQYSFDLSPEALAGGGRDARTGATPMVDLEVLLQPLDGDPDVYVTLDGKRPTAEHYQYRSSDWGSTADRIVVGPHDSLYQRLCPGGRCKVRVGVSGFHDSSYSLVLSALSKPIRLQLDQPMATTLRPTLAQRFTVPWPAGGGVGSVRVTVSPQSGPAPRVYASCRTLWPNVTVNDWKLEETFALATQTLVIDTAMGEGKGCGLGKNLTLAVSADSLAQVSVLVSTDAVGSIPRLLPGVQTPGEARKNGISYFVVRMSKGEYADIELILTVTSGEVDMYVSDSYEGRPVVDSARGVVSSYTLSSAQEGDDRLTIKHSLFEKCGQGQGWEGGEGGREACYFVVGVVGRKWARSEFRLLAKTHDATVVLHDGMAVRDQVAGKSYAYYKVLVVNPQLDLTLTITPLSGDPDLYMGVPPVTRPSRDNHTWASRSFGADSLTVQAAELKKHCEPDPAIWLGCSVYVGVHAWTDASFSIMASLNMGWLNPSILFPGLPQSGEVVKGAYHYYQLRIPPVAADAAEPVIRLTLLPEDESDQDLYITFSRDKEPGKESFDVRSTSWSNNDEVVLAPGAAHYCTDCTLYVAVYGYEGGPYSLVATLSSTQQQLQLGVPVRGTVAASSSVFYMVDWHAAAAAAAAPTDPDDKQEEDNGLIITLTPEAGRPQVYASCSHAYPNATAHGWMLDSREDQVLRINSTSSSSAAAAGGGAAGGEGSCRLPGKLWLAVVNDGGGGGIGGGAASYSLMVAKDNSSTSVPLLVPGTPTAGSVGFHHFQYYQVRMGAAGFVDMGVVLTVTRGEADVYVSQSFESRPVYDAGKGKVLNWTAKSEARGNDRVSVPHTLFPACHDDCYFVIGVLGKSVVPTARFSLVVRRQESIVALQDGVALRDEVGDDEYVYFSVKVTDPEADLSIHLTPLSGDPDLFVDLSPNTRPSKENHTWASRSFGSDTLTLQAADMKTHCTPSPAQGVVCDYFVSVFGWKNASFSILASLHRGWKEPIQLFPGLPQAGEVSQGEYVYYSFYVPPDTPSLRFVLTPQNLAGGGGKKGGSEDVDDWESWSDAWEDIADQDLFLTTSREKEPGETNYDLRSATWAGVEEIMYAKEEMVAAGGGGEGAFCTSCTVYLAVYGYAGVGEYTLRVETGVSMLQNAVSVTGHLSTGGAAHYKIYNSGDPKAHLMLSAVTLSGDADLYVLAVEDEDEEEGEDEEEEKPRVMPSKDHYHWRSNRVGDDVVEILPSDPHFCSACEYLVTVDAFTNTSYVLTASVETMSVVPLAGGRPQKCHVDKDSMQYFSVVLGSSVEDLRVSLTMFSGHAELYVADRVDMAHLPLPGDRTSWKYTSKNNLKGRNEVVIPGPHVNRTRFAIGVQGLEDASSFSVLASFSQSPVFLQEGVPVQQSLSPGKMAWFIYRVAKAEDVRVAVTTLSGDPDILASTTHPRPACVKPPGGTGGEGGASFACSNYTWIAQTYQNDEMVILHDLPCEEVGNTKVNASACSSGMLAPGRLLYIGVYAYDDTAETTFTLTLTTGGGHTNLLPGRPQHGNTRLGAICQTRRVDGTCDTSSMARVSKAEVAYYRFLVSPPSALFGEDDAAHVSVVLQPVCNALTFKWEGMEERCAIGCACDPLELYVWSCAESECKPEDEYPHPGHYQVKQTAAQSHSTVFLAHDRYNPMNGFCNPKTAGQPCLYFVTVYHAEVEEGKEGGSFTITASTNKDVTILPTRRNPAPPDGLVSSSLDTVDATAGGVKGSKRYQMYASKGGDVQLTLEACTGEVNLAVCDGSCRAVYPSQGDYRYFADAQQICTREGCRPSAGGGGLPRIALDHIMEDSFFLTVNGTGKYMLKVATTTEGHAIAPVLAPPSSTSSTPVVKHIHTDRVTLNWPAAILTVPGQKRGRGGRDGGGDAPQGVKYKVFAFPEPVLREEEGREGGVERNPSETPVLHTVCGVEHYAAVSQAGREGGGEEGGEGGRGRMRTYVGKVPAGTTSHTVTDLVPGTGYRFVVMALCDAVCLRASSQKPEGSFLPCGGSEPCQDQYGLYAMTRATTAGRGGWMGGGGGGLGGKGGFVLLLLLVAVLAVVMLMVQRAKQRRESGGGGVAGTGGREGGREGGGGLAVRRPPQVDYEMTISPTGAASAARGVNELASPREGRGGGRAGGRYERLLMQREEEEEEGGRQQLV